MAKRSATSVQGDRFSDELLEPSAEDEAADLHGKPLTAATPTTSNTTPFLGNGGRTKREDTQNHHVGMDLGKITAEELVNCIDDLQAQLHSLKLSVVKANPCMNDQRQVGDPGCGLEDPSPTDVPLKGTSNVNRPRQIVFNSDVTTGGCQTSVSAGPSLAAPDANTRSALDMISGDTAIHSTFRRRRRNDAIMTDLLRDFLQSKRIMAVQYKGEAAEGTLPDCASPSDVSDFLANYPEHHPKYHSGPDPANVLYDWHESLTRKNSRWNLRATDLLAKEFHKKLVAGKLFFSDGELAIFNPALHSVEELRILIPTRLRPTQNWWREADAIRQAEELHG